MLASGITSIPYAASLSAGGGVPPYTWSLGSGNLPPGLVLSPHGTLAGTPTSAGAFSFTAQVTDLAHPEEVGNVVVSLTIIDPLLVTGASLPESSPGVFYNAALAATGGIAPYSWRVTLGNLPAGLSLDATTGGLSGVAMDVGLSTFTVQVSDSQNPAVTSSASLSISVNTAPPRNTVLYLGDESRQQINSDGSLTQLTALSAVPPPTALSPTLPVGFAINNGNLISMLVNPDYSVTAISSAALLTMPANSGLNYALTVDPTGSNLYLSGYIDSHGTQGISVYPADGSLQVLNTVAVPDILGQPSSPGSPIALTPDGAWAYVAPCPSSYNGIILIYSRSSDGRLTQTAAYALPAATCASNLTISPDGKYLADVETLNMWPGGLYMQVYGVASDGTMAPALNQPFPVPMPGFPWAGTVRDMIWDESSTYLLPIIATSPSIGTGFDVGGVAALNFSGSTLTETSPPSGGGGLLVQRTGSFVYTNIKCTPRTFFCPSCWVGPDPCLTPLGPNGFSLVNGQLQPLPNSPFPYSFGTPTAIY